MSESMEERNESRGERARESREDMKRRHSEERRRARGGKAEKAEKRARGGKADEGIGATGGPDGSTKGMEIRTAGDPDVVKEAERRKRGGGVHKGKMPTMVHGSAPRHHANRPGRKSGGSVGADSHPMTEAARLKGPEGLSRDGGVDREDD